MSQEFKDLSLDAEVAPNLKQVSTSAEASALCHIHVHDVRHVVAFFVLVKLRLLK